MQDAVAEAEVDSVPPEDVPTVLPEAALVGAASGLPRRAGGRATILLAITGLPSAMWGEGRPPWC